MRRTAHQFLGDESAAEVDWSAEAWHPGDPSEWWVEDDWSCTRCTHVSKDLPEAITHAVKDHDLGRIDFLASTPHHARKIDKLYETLRADVRGRVYVVGANVGQHVKAPHTRLQRGSARNSIGRDSGPYTVVGAIRDLRLIGNRSGWSLDGFAN
jgi:hypothetical protein